MKRQHTLNSYVCIVFSYFLRYIGQTFVSGETNQEEDPELKEEKLERQFADANELGSMLGQENSAYRPDDPSLYDQTPFVDSLKKSLKEQAKKFVNFFKTALFGKGGQVYYLYYY
jgi:hypothetical protein